MDSDEVFYDIINDKDNKIPELVEDIDTDSDEEAENIEEELVTNESGKETNDESNDESSDESSEDETDKMYDIASLEYQEYKNKILGMPLYTKYNISSFILKNKKVKLFFENIKDYGENLKIDETHCQNITEALLSKENPIMHEEFTIVEYTDFKTDDVESLCELFDGHHRKKAFSDIFKQKSNFKSIIRICLIRSDKPGSSQTNILFRELNTRKPFEVDFTLNDISKLVISRLNDEFNNSITGFIFIKDKSESKIYRPSIQKHIINNSIQNRLDELKRRFNINRNHININLIINKFKAFNNEISKNKKKIRDDDKSISESMIDKASRNKCFLSLVNLDKLVRECIGTDFN